MNIFNGFHFKLKKNVRILEKPMYLILQNCFNKHADIHIEFAFIGEYESFYNICLKIQVKYLKCVTVI